VSVGIGIGPLGSGSCESANGRCLLAAGASISTSYRGPADEAAERVAAEARGPVAASQVFVAGLDVHSVNPCDLPGATVVRSGSVRLI
jgi:hypothetical protein